MANSGIALLARGFRPFFLGATLFAILGMGLWMAAYLYQLPVPLNGMSMFQWHAHEMVFGYGAAVIAGFLLTAAQNWTGEKTASGAALALMVSLWALARLLMLDGSQFLLAAAIADLLFILTLAIAIAGPVLKVRQKRQAPVLLIITLMAAANLMFYLGAAGFLENGVRIGNYSGLYLVLGMVLFMGRRVIPFFTERGVEPPVKLNNSHWNDVATFILYPLFFLSELVLPHSATGAALAGALFISNSIRLNAWHTLGVWQKPLLWGLFAAFLMINLGFLLRGMMAVTTIPAFLYIHAFSVGGIGIITISMMARVTLGHTGRSVQQAPSVMTIILIGMVAATVFRLFFPLMDPGHYSLWVGLAGSLWIGSFALFAFTFIPILIKPRADGKPG